MIVVDASVWIAALRAGAGREARVLQQLPRNDLAAEQTLVVLTAFRRHGGE